MKDHLGAKLDAYLDGSLDASGSEEVETHLKICESCKEELKMTQALAEKLQENRPAEKSELSFKDYWKRLMGRHEEVKTMTAIQRLKRVAQSNIHAAIDAMEDSSKMLKQLVREMEHSLSDTRDEVAEAMTVEKKFERRWKETVEEAKHWEDRASLALKKGREDLAREAVKEQIIITSLADEFKEELEKQKTRVAELKKLFARLNDDFHNIKRHQSITLNRLKQAGKGSASGSYRSASRELAQLIDGIMERYAVQDAYREIDSTQNLADTLKEMDQNELVEKKLIELKKRDQE